MISSKMYDKTYRGVDFPDSNNFLGVDKINVKLKKRQQMDV